MSLDRSVKSKYWADNLNSMVDIKLNNPATPDDQSKKYFRFIDRWEGKDVTAISDPYRVNYTKCSEETCDGGDYGSDKMAYTKDKNPSTSAECKLKSGVASKRMCVWKYKNMDANKDKCCAGDPSILTADGFIDGFQCPHHYIDYATPSRDVWMPWSPSCGDLQGPGTISEYCSGSDNGVSRLVADKRCTDWCKKFPTLCDTVKNNYCATNKEDKLCKCYNIQNNEYYKLIKEIQSKTTDPATLGSLGLPMCWVPGCDSATDLSDALLNSQMVAEKLRCTGKGVNICQQVINIADSTNVDISDVNWTQVCPGQNPSVACTEGSCTNGNACDGVSGKCKCGVNLPCYGSINCVNGVCEQCTNDEQCADGNICVEGVCKSLRPEPEPEPPKDNSNSKTNYVPIIIGAVVVFLLLVIAMIYFSGK